MDLNKTINEVTEQVIKDKLPTIIEEKITKMTESIMNDLFSNFGNVAKGIKAKIEEHLDVNLQRFDIIDYNALVAQTINEQLVQQVNMQPIIEMTRNITGFLNKKRFTLQDMADMVIETAKEDEPAGEITCIVDYNHEHDWFHVYFDTETDQDKDECGIELLLFKLHGENSYKIGSMKHRGHYSAYSKSKINPQRMTIITNLEHKFFRMYSAQVELDMKDAHQDNINTSWWFD